MLLMTTITPLNGQTPQERVTNTNSPSRTTHTRAAIRVFMFYYRPCGLHLRTRRAMLESNAWHAEIVSFWLNRADATVVKNLWQSLGRNFIGYWTRRIMLQQECISFDAYDRSHGHKRLRFILVNAHVRQGRNSGTNSCPTILNIESLARQLEKSKRCSTLVREPEFLRS